MTGKTVNEEKKERVMEEVSQPTGSVGGKGGESGSGGGSGSESGGVCVGGKGESVEKWVLSLLVGAKRGLDEGDPLAVWDMVKTMVQLVAVSGEGRKALKEQFGLPHNCSTATLGERVVGVLKESLVETATGESEGEGEVGEEEGEEGSNELTIEEYVGQELEEFRRSLRESMQFAMVEFGEQLKAAVVNEVNNVVEKKLDEQAEKLGQKKGGETKGRKRKGRNGKEKGKRERKDKGKETASSGGSSESVSMTSSSASSSDRTSESSAEFGWAGGDLSTASSSSSSEWETSRKAKKRNKGKGKSPSWSGMKASEMATGELVEAGQNLLRWLKKEKKKMGKRSKAELKAFKGMWPQLRENARGKKGKKRKGAKSALQAAVNRMQELGKMVLQIKVERVDEKEIATLFGKDVAKEVKARERKAEGSKGNKGRNGSGSGFGSAGRFRGFRANPPSNGFGRGGYNRDQGSGYNDGRRPGGNRGRGGNQGFPGRCNRCNQWGHRAAQCSQPKACYICGDTRHLANQCPRD